MSTVRYTAPVAQARFNLRLSPFGWPGQSVRSATLDIDPAPRSRDDTPGPYGVNTSLIHFDAPIERLSVKSEFIVETVPPPLPDADPPKSGVIAEARARRDLSVLSPAPYLFASRVAVPDPRIAEWAHDYLASHEGIVAAVSSLMAAIYGEFTYSSGVTTTSTPPVEAFTERAGVCQDFAHIMVIALRAHGIPAAYVSGYLRTLPPPGQAKLIGADAMHAWVNVWCGPEIGWVGFDPTNNCLARGDHILIGMGRDYADVSPIDGTFVGHASQKMTSAVDVSVVDQGVHV